MSLAAYGVVALSVASSVNENRGRFLSLLAGVGVFIAYATIYFVFNLDYYAELIFPMFLLMLAANIFSIAIAAVILFWIAEFLVKSPISILKSLKRFFDWL